MTIADAVRHSFDLPSANQPSLATRPAPVRTAKRSGHDLNLGICFFGRGVSGLGPQWRVISAIPTAIERAPIDHLLIGPSGVFAVCTDPVSLRETTFRARRAATLLSGKALFDVEVQAVASLTPAAAGLAAEMNDAVLVVAHDQIAEQLDNLPVTLGRPSIERIYSVARHLSTWQPKTVAWSDSF